MLRAYIAVTDPMWLRRLRVIGASEVNFWQPRPAPLKQLPGTPWIFKVRGSNTVAGMGIFSYHTIVPMGVAWSTFGPANGVEDYPEFTQRLRNLRHDGSGSDLVGCVVLEQVSILNESDYIRAPVDWKPNTVRGEYYDLEVGEGRRLLMELSSGAPLSRISYLQEAPGGFYDEPTQRQRRGQGAFRLMVMDAYGRRCAITGEGTLPALEAAHIRPFADTPVHSVQNGILMRSDIHDLFDQGYVTVTPDLSFHVSKRIRDEFHNGVIYYALDGSRIRIPERSEAQPDRGALEWHSSKIYLG